METNDFKLVDIPGFEGKYKITEDGRVWTTKYQRFKSQTLAGAGYPYVHLNYNNVNKSYSVHRLVATTFIPNPENKPTVNHIDGNKLNNHVTNLEWATRSENTIHAFEHKLMNIWKDRALTKEEVIVIRKLYYSGRYSQSFLADVFMVKVGVIKKLVQNRRYREKDLQCNVSGLPKLWTRMNSKPKKNVS